MTGQPAGCGIGIGVRFCVGVSVVGAWDIAFVVGDGANSNHARRVLISAPRVSDGRRHHSEMRSGIGCLMELVNRIECFSARLYRPLRSSPGYGLYASLPMLTVSTPRIAIDIRLLQFSACRSCRARAVDRPYRRRSRMLASGEDSPTATSAMALALMSGAGSRMQTSLWQSEGVYQRRVSQEDDRPLFGGGCV